MLVDLSKDPIEVNRSDGPYDAFVQEFLARVPPDWPYVLVSGYVALLFGRERHTEDIDMLVTPPSDEQFHALWQALKPTFWCLQTDKEESARDEYLRSGIPLRFAKAGGIEPNMEFKLAHDPIGLYALNHRQGVRLNGNLLWIPPPEQQIAYKLWLGSDKDFEDAAHLAATLNEILKGEKVQYWCDKLGVSDSARKVIS